MRPAIIQSLMFLHAAEPAWWASVTRGVSLDAEMTPSFRIETREHSHRIPSRVAWPHGASTSPFCRQSRTFYVRVDPAPHVAPSFRIRPGYLPGPQFPEEESPYGAPRAREGKYACTRTRRSC